MQAYKWNEVLKLLGISKKTLYRIVKIVYPNGKEEMGYSEKDIESFKNILDNEQQNYKEDLGIEKIKDNEYYAKIIKDDKIFGVGTFSSTDLEIDRYRFESKKMKLIIINEDEANILFREIYKVSK